MICNLGIPARWLRRPSALNHRRRMRIVQTAAFARQIASCCRGSVAAGVRHGTQWTGKRLIRRRTLAMIRVPRISPSRMDGDRALEAATKYRPPTRQRPHLGHDGPRISPARQLSWWPSPLWRPQVLAGSKGVPLAVRARRADRSFYFPCAVLLVARLAVPAPISDWRIGIMLCTPVRARIGQPSSDGSCETAIHTKCASNAQGRLEQGQLDR